VSAVTSRSMCDVYYNYSSLPTCKMIIILTIILGIIKLQLSQFLLHLKRHYLKHVSNFVTNCNTRIFKYISQWTVTYIKQQIDALIIIIFNVIELNYLHATMSLGIFVNIPTKLEIKIYLLCQILWNTIHRLCILQSFIRAWK
jgi:hypothetical protein